MDMRFASLCSGFDVMTSPIHLLFLFSVLFLSPYISLIGELLSRSL